MNDVISLLIELKSHAMIAQELMISSDFDGPDWKKLTFALESIDRINRALDEMLNSAETEALVEERVQQIKRYQRAPYIPDLVSSVWDEEDRLASEEAL